MIPFVDYHTHTTFSCDARHTVDAMCRHAIQIGLQEIAFTEHADFEHLDSCRDYLEPAAYIRAVEAARARYDGRLTIRAGIEVGEPHRYPEKTADLLDAFPFDFVLGSLHWVDGYPGFSKQFFKGRTPEEAWRSYFEELVLLCEAGDFDVLAHLDLPKRHDRTFTPEPYAGPIRRALAHLVERGIGIEINCSGFRYPVNEPLPGTVIVRWFRELGGEILTIGTDAHKASHLGEDFEQAVAIAQEAGFETISRFHQRESLHTAAQTDSRQF